MVRVGKSIGMALVMFLSLFYLTKSASIAAVAALIPLVLGSFGIVMEFAYGLAALCLIAAVVWSLMPAPLKNRVSTLVASTVDSFTVGSK